MNGKVLKKKQNFSTWDRNSIKGISNGLFERMKIKLKTVMKRKINSFWKILHNFKGFDVWFKISNSTFSSWISMNYESLMSNRRKEFKIKLRLLGFTYILLLNLLDMFSFKRILEEILVLRSTCGLISLLEMLSVDLFQWIILSCYFNHH